jgi:imidazole glycerol-phosphate synthase subunit HisH
MKKIAIIDYGAGNLQSVKFALERLGHGSVVTGNACEISKADKIIFPGVGHAQSAMHMLRERGLDKLIPTLQQPVLGICLGMQLMCMESEEGNTKTLGIFPIHVKKFDHGLKVPHMGWNTIMKLNGPLFEHIPEREFMYFVHSYYVPENEFSIASSDYGFPFSAAVQKNNFFACQFHPEKSGKWGQQLLLNFLGL